MKLISLFTSIFLFLAFQAWALPNPIPLPNDPNLQEDPNLAEDVLFKVISPADIPENIRNGVVPREPEIKVPKIPKVGFNLTTYPVVPPWLRGPGKITPTQPREPAEKVEPVPTQPREPAQKVEPVPTQPREPAKKVEPVPTQPREPAQVVEPIQPKHPIILPRLGQRVYMCTGLDFSGLCVYVIPLKKKCLSFPSEYMEKFSSISPELGLQCEFFPHKYCQTGTSTTNYDPNLSSSEDVGFGASLAVRSPGYPRLDLEPLVWWYWNGRSYRGFHKRFSSLWCDSYGI